MNKKLITLALSAGMMTTFSIQSIALEYIETPVANQIDDLLDEDNDGVINARDLCAETPRTAEIDNDGCGTKISASEEVSILILFNNNSAEINSGFQQQIDTMSDFLTQYPETSVELQGYASKVGNSKYNLKLSKRRADNVRLALLNNGIDESRIKIVGFGDTKLADYGNDEVSHARNRKVKATVVGSYESIDEEWTIFTTIPK
ncbi:OmpA family protein [Vibrio mexicanus]|uniref:OmpA family protein n=1 Tax=Vibrio mexicanus TaxID=1004326 RepID=UPI00063C0B1D|nr:OmpA family protein [Vibrio mexicanus]